MISTSFTRRREPGQSDPYLGQKGNALIVALLVLFVLSTIALAFVSATKTERQISGNNLRESQALYVAEAGFSEALARMSSKSSPSYVGETGSNPTPGWGRYIILANGGSAGDPECNLTASDSLDNDGDGSIDESGEAYPEVVSSQANLAQPIQYPWVKLRYKVVNVGGVNRVVLFGDDDNNPTTRPVQNVVSGVPVLIVTSNGRQSNATKTIEIEAVKLPGLPVPGSVYTEGTLECQGTAFHIDGHDYDPIADSIITSSQPVPGVVATGGAGAVSCNTPNGWDNIEGAGAPPSVAGATYDLDLAGYRNSYASMTDLVYNGSQSNPSTSGWGSASDYKIVYVKGGDLHLSGQNSGGGVLLIDGDLKVSGQFTWYGLIICMGNIEFTGGGSGIHVYGCVMTQGSISASGSVSGQADLFYSSQTISKLSEMNSYSVALWKEK
jgi:hypothetical protein